MRRMTPVAQRVLGESDGITLRMRTTYAMALYKDDGATLDDLREAVTTLEDTRRIARRVLGGTYPTTVGIEKSLRKARAAFRARGKRVLGRALLLLEQSIRCQEQLRVPDPRLGLFRRVGLGVGRWPPRNAARVLNTP